MSWQIEVDQEIPEWAKEACCIFANLFGLWGWNITVQLDDDPSGEGYENSPSSGSVRCDGVNLNARIKLERSMMREGDRSKILPTLFHEFAHISLAEIESEVTNAVSSEVRDGFRRSIERTVVRTERAMTPMIETVIEFGRREGWAKIPNREEARAD